MTVQALPRVVQALAVLVQVLTLMVGFGVEIRAQDVVLDRMLAIVNGDVVTLSDVRAARQLRLMERAETMTDDQLVTALVERRLVLAEVARATTAPEPTAEQQAVRRESWQAMLRPADLAAALTSAGLKDVTLEAWLRDDLRIAAYLDQRFNAVAQPTRDQALAYFRAHDVEFAVNGIAPPFAAVEAEVRKRVAADRRATRIREWIDSLKLRAEIRLIK